MKNTGDVLDAEGTSLFSQPKFFSLRSNDWIDWTPNRKSQKPNKKGEKGILVNSKNGRRVVNMSTKFQLCQLKMQ